MSEQCPICNGPLLVLRSYDAKICYECHTQFIANPKRPPWWYNPERAPKDISPVNYADNVVIRCC